MCSVPDVADALQNVLSTVANALGRKSGFVQRASKVTGALWVQTLVFTWLSKPQATLEEMAQTASLLGLPLSAQGVDARFTPQAARLLQQVLEQALGVLVQAEPVLTPLLQRFTGVYLYDSTVIALPDVLASLWQGCGGRVDQGSAAALKVQVVLDLLHGSVQGTLQAGRAQDKNAPTQAWNLPRGALKIADLGYFSVAVLAKLHTQGVFFLSRIQIGTKVALGDTFFDLVEVGARLRSQPGVLADLPVRLGAGQKLPCRLLAVRVPDKVAEERRRRLHYDAGRKGQAVSQARLSLADWNLFVTNAPAELLTLDEALVLVRARWQIELLFKLFKSAGGQVDVWRSHKPWRILCEVYAKLLALLVQHWLFLVSCWRFPDRSLVKARQTVARYALALAAAFACTPALRTALEALVRCLSRGCRVNTRKTKPNTCQLLAHPPPLGGLG